MTDGASITVRYSMTFDPRPLEHAAKRLAQQGRVCALKDLTGTAAVFICDPQNTLGRAVLGGLGPLRKETT